MIVGAHPAWPWKAESLAIARHKTNFFIDLSAWGPQVLPTPGRAVRRLDPPGPRPLRVRGRGPGRRWLTEFDQLPFKPAVRQKILLAKTPPAPPGFLTGQRASLSRS